MISGFKIFLVMLLKQLDLGKMSVYSYFTSIAKENLHFSLIYSFYCSLVKKGLNPEGFLGICHPRALLIDRLLMKKV